MESSIRNTVAFFTVTGYPVAGSRTSGPGTSKPAMLMNSVALVPLSIVAILPHGPLMFGPVHVATSWPLESSTSNPPSPLVRVVPSTLGVLPTITHPVLSIVMAVVKPTPPGHCARCCGSLANSVAFFVDGL